MNFFYLQKKVLPMLTCLSILFTFFNCCITDKTVNANSSHSGIVDKSKMYLVFPVLLDGVSTNAATLDEIIEFRAQMESLDSNAKVTWAMDNNFIFDEINRPKIAKVLEFVDTYGDEIAFGYGFANNTTLDQFKYFFNEFIYMFRYNANGLAGVHENGTLGQMSVWDSIPDKYKPRAVLDYSINIEQMTWLKNTYGIDICFWAATQYNVDGLTGDGSPLLPYYANVNNTLVPAQSSIDNSGITVINSISIDPIGCSYSSGESRFTIHPADPLNTNAEHQISIINQYYNNVYNPINTINYLSLFVDIRWLWRTPSLKQNWDYEIAALQGRNSEVVSVTEFVNLWKTVGGANNENNVFTFRSVGTGTIASDGNESSPHISSLWTETKNNRLILYKKDTDPKWNVVDFTDYTINPIPILPYTTNGRYEDVSYIPPDGRNFKVSKTAPLSIDQKARIRAILASIGFSETVNEISPEPTTIELNDVAIREGESLILTPIIKDQYGNIISILEYSSSDSSKVTVTSSGAITANAYMEGSNRANITINMPNGSISKTINVEILKDSRIKRTVTGVDLVGYDIVTTNFNTSGSAIYAALIKDQFGNNMYGEEVNWEILDQAQQPIKNITIDDQGKLSFLTSPGAITVDLRATSKTNNLVLGKKTLTLITLDKSINKETSNSGQVFIAGNIIEIINKEKLDIKKSLIANYRNLFGNGTKEIMYKYVGTEPCWAIINSQGYNTIISYDIKTKNLSPVLFIKKGDYMELLMEKDKIYILKNIFNTFSDINATENSKEINDLASRLIISGISNTKFIPDKNMTKAEFITLIIKMLGVTDSDKLSANIYDDVNVNSWYYSYIAQATELGLISGYNNRFKPNDYITKEQIYIILLKMSGNILDYRASTNENVNTNLFTDYNTINDWAKEAFDWAISNNLLEVNKDRKINPTEPLTRSEICLIIYKFLCTIK